MRIGVMFPPGAPGTNYRVIAVANALVRRGHDIVVCAQSPFDPIPVADLCRCDVVHIHRSWGRAVEACIDRLHRNGVGVTWDHDVDIRATPPGSPSIRGLSRRDLQGILAGEPRTAARADVVTAPSPAVAQRFEQAARGRVVEIDNYLDPGQYADSPRLHQGFVIGWIALPDHEVDARTLRIADVLRAVLERHRHVRVVTVGIRLDLDSDRYTHHPVLPFDQLREMTRGFDVGLAPVADTAMTRGLSSVKVKEYGAAAVPWLASDRGPYAELGPSAGGMLVADDEWEDALDEVIRSPSERVEMRYRAQEWARAQSIEMHVGRWTAVFERAHAAARQRQGPAGAPVAR